MSKKIRLLSVLIACSLFIALFAACDGTSGKTSSKITMEELLKKDWSEIEKAAKEEGSLIFSVWYNEAGFTEILKKFTEKYGIKVELVVANQTAFLQKALAEKEGATGTIDVAVIGGEMVKTLIDAKAMAGPLLDKIEKKELLDPGLSAYQEGVAHNGYLVPLYRNQTGFLYNPDKIAEKDLPQTWEDLNNFIKNNPLKFGMCPPDKGGSGQALTMLAIQELTGGLEQYYGDSDVVESKVENWTLVWDWFKENKNNITYTTSNNDSISRVNQGELYLVPAWDDDSCVARKAGELSEKMKLYIPKMGLAGGGDSLGILANAQNKAAALLLVNWLVNEEGQTLVADILNAIPARTDIPASMTMISQEDMQYRTTWIPAAYKTKFSKDFTTYVLQ